MRYSVGLLYYYENVPAGFLMDTRTSAAAVFLMAAGLFYRGGPQNSSNSSSATQTSGNTQVVSGTGGSVTTSSELGPWTPVCRYVATAEKEAPSQSVNLELKLDGSSGDKKLRGNFSLSGSQQEQEGVAKEQFCLAPPKDGSSTGWHVKTLIATVPNPELTHLSLTFDRYVESITWALADGDLGSNSYSFDSYWFPWRPDQKEETDPEKRKAAEKEREKRSNTPGILLFRRKPGPESKRTDPDPAKDLLLVFLVGETPTSGISRVAFNRAWTYATTLADGELPICGNSKPCIGILGPNFTGSMASLRLLLDK